MNNQFDQVDRTTHWTGLAGWGGPVRMTRCPCSAYSSYAWCVALLAMTFSHPGSTAPLQLSQSPGAASSAGTVASTLVVSAMSTRGDSVMFVGSHEPVQWAGAVTAFMVAARTGAVSSAGYWGTVPASGARAAQPVTTATLLDGANFKPADRLVLSAAAGSPVSGAGRSIGISWAWNSLPVDSRKAMNTLGTQADSLGSQRVDFVRGDHTLEIAGGGTFRNRASRHGAIVNSKLWYLAGAPGNGYSAIGYGAFKTRLRAREAMLYVGANDGMLHGFSAATGQEKIAYVPFGLHARLPHFTSAHATLRYLVDGSPFTADIDVDGQWKTYLAGFPGLGGTGYFVLDVSDPALFDASSAARLVVMDHTGGADADIGHITGEPVREHENTALTRQICQLNDGRWALITGNGYNSANEAAVLLIQYLDGARELKKIPAIRVSTSGAATGNGLSAPRLIDLNGDRIPDVAYAGDLLGNLWKFDLSSSDPGAWRTAFGGTPLYVARDASTPVKAQPITSAPVWLAHPQGGLMVVFGTGRNLTDADRTDTSIQSLYGVYDDTVVTREAHRVKLLEGSDRLAASRATLVQQHIGQTPTVTGAGGALWTVSSHPVPYTGADRKKGWYIDLPPGERVLGNPGWFEGNLVDIFSSVPATAKTWLTTLDAINGNAPKSQIHAYVPAIKAHTERPTGTASRLETGLRAAVTNASDRSEKGLCASQTGCADRILLPHVALRPSWRQLQ